jgi:hypothetical protein
MLRDPAAHKATSTPVVWSEAADDVQERDLSAYDRAFGLDDEGQVA